MNQLFLLSTHKQNSVCSNEQTNILKLSTLNTSMEKQNKQDRKTGGRKNKCINCNKEITKGFSLCNNKCVKEYNKKQIANGKLGLSKAIGSPD